MVFAPAADGEAGTRMERLAFAVRAVAPAALSSDEPVVVLGAGPTGG